MRRRSVRSPRATRLALVAAVIALALLAAGCQPRLMLPVYIDDESFRDSARSTPATCEHGVLPFRDLRVGYRVPSGGGQWPLVIVAHGYNISPVAYDALLNDIAAGGYVVAAPYFPVSGPGPCPSRGDWAGQAGDISAVISYIHSGQSHVSPYIDRRYPVGVTGHSDGGITVAIMAHIGGFHDPRVGAYAELSGAIPNGWGPVVPNPVPVMAVNGDADRSNGANWAHDFYNRSFAPRAIYIASGDHTSPYLGGDARTTGTRDAIVAFFDRFVRDDLEANARFGFAAANAPYSATEWW